MTARRRKGVLTRAGNTMAGFWHWITHTGRTTINVGVFLVVAAFLIVLLVVTIFRVQPRYVVHATFVQSGGVFTGQEVTYRGVTVGRVGELRVVREGVEIELAIEETYNEIPASDITARVMFKSAVGEQFVDLLPSTRSGPYLEDGDEIPIENTELPVQQEELLRLLDRVLAGIPPSSLGNLIDALGEGLGGRGPALDEALAATDPLTELLADRTEELNRLAESGDVVGTAFDATSQEFIDGIRGLGDTASALGRGSDGLARLLQAGQSHVPEIAGLIAVRKAEIDSLIADLALTTRISVENLRSVEDTLDWLPLLLDALVRSYDPEINRFRFGLIVGEMRNEPCSYGTPRRTVDETGDAPYHPVLDFGCV